MPDWKPTNWRAVAAALDPPIPADAVERIVPVMDAMEARFRPLQRAIPFGSDPWVSPEELGPEVLRSDETAANQSAVPKDVE